MVAWASTSCSSTTGPLLSPGSGTFGASVLVDLPDSRVTQTSGGTASASAGAFESFQGSGSVFTVTGTDGHNALTTGAADDLVDPRAGPDRVSTGSGADRVLARDGFGDRMECGPDADTVEADQFDELFDCENVDVAQVLPAGVELDAPVCTVTGRAAGCCGASASCAGSAPRSGATSRRASRLA